MGFGQKLEGDAKGTAIKALNDKIEEYFKNTVAGRKFIGGEKPCIAD